tara:strand:+ start:8591 stop:8773 length:183 start_codon:yes stop_codon:yes gene_type:complete
MYETVNEDRVFEFLDDLRESGVTNMYGASPYIREAFNVTRYEANRLLSKWMETYSERNAK